MHKKKNILNKFVNLKELTPLQLGQYEEAISEAFPAVIGQSQVIKTYWGKLEDYFPSFQLFLISNQGDLIGFINTVPFQFGDSLDELPDNGWDWMLTKGINDFDNNQPPNFLGGLQVIVRRKYQKSGFSKQILSHAKQVYKLANLQNLVIPIRPTQKHAFPKMTMQAYLNLKEKNEIYDPWIRTHVKGGAQIIKICEKSMTVRGDMIFWKSIFKREFVESGKYLLSGALNTITIDIENNLGEYIEPNIWIKYD